MEATNNLFSLLPGNIVDLIAIDTGEATIWNLALVSQETFKYLNQTYFESCNIKKFLPCEGNNYTILTSHYRQFSLFFIAKLNLTCQGQTVVEVKNSVEEALKLKGPQPLFDLTVNIVTYASNQVLRKALPLLAEAGTPIDDYCVRTIFFNNTLSLRAAKLLFRDPEKCKLLNSYYIGYIFSKENTNELLPFFKEKVPSLFDDSVLLYRTDEVLLEALKWVDHITGEFLEEQIPFRSEEIILALLEKFTDREYENAGRLITRLNELTFQSERFSLEPLNRLIALFTGK